MIDVAEGNQGPQASENPPVRYPKYGKKQRGPQHNAHGAPTVEGMQQAHHAFLVFKGTGLYNGAAQDLDQPASDGVDNRGEKDAGKGGGQKIRQERQPYKPKRGGYLREDRASAVAYPVDNLYAGKIHDKLGDIEASRDKGQLAQGYAVQMIKGKKQQRRIV